MKKNLVKQIALLASLSAAATVTTAMSAQAQTATDMSELLNSDTEIQVENVPLNFDDSSQPVPGTVETSAHALLQSQPTQTTEFNSIPEPEEADSTVAQRNIRPGRATRAGRSYVGAGVNIGFDGDTALGDTNFTVISKIGLTNTLSVRPSVIIGDDTAFLIPVTYDFQLRQTDPF
ncbi:MAG: hypothetical protein ACOC3E_02415, partial [Cyanobacteriota bacterium]